MGLDYRVVSVGGNAFKVLGIIDFCVAPVHRGRGLGSSMLVYLEGYAKSKMVDFIILISESGSIYLKNGYQNIETEHSWLRLHEHQSHGVASEEIAEFYVKSINKSVWPSGKVDWLGYMF